MFRDKQIVGIEVDSKGNTRPLYESSGRSLPFLKRTLLTLSLAVAAKDAVNSVRPVHPEDQQQAHTLQVSGDTHRRLTDARAFHDSVPRGARRFAREHSTYQNLQSREQKAQQAKDLAKFIDTSGALAQAAFFGFNKRRATNTILAVSMLMTACGVQGGQVIATETASVVAPATAEVIQELSKEFLPFTAQQKEAALQEWLNKPDYRNAVGHVYPYEYKVTMNGQDIGSINLGDITAATQFMMMIHGNGETAEAWHIKYAIAESVINPGVNNPNADPNILAEGTVIRLDGSVWGTATFQKEGSHIVLRPASHPNVVLDINPTDSGVPRPIAGGALFSPAESILVTPTPEPTATPTPEVPAIVWNSTKDGKILWTNEGMADGLFQIKDAKSAELHHDILEALWAVNTALVNPDLKDTPADIIAFHDQFVKSFPTPQALIDYVENGGAPMDIYIPVNNHLAPGYESSVASTIVQKVEKVDLSSSAIGFEILPLNQITPASITRYQTEPDYFRNDPYVDVIDEFRQMFITPTERSGKTVLSWTFRNRAIAVDKNPYSLLPLYQEQSAEEKIKGATQLLRSCLDQTIKLSSQDAKIIAGPPGLTYYVYLSYYKSFFTYFGYTYNTQAANVANSPLELK